MPGVFTKIKNKIRGRRTPQVSAAHQPPAPDPHAAGTTPDPNQQNSPPPPPPPSPPPQATPDPPANRLLPEEKRKLVKRKNSFFQGFLTKVGGMTLTAADKNPGTPEGMGKGDLARMGWGVVDKLGSLATESLGIGGNEKYGKSPADIAMKNGDMASRLPMADAIQSSIRTLVSVGRTIKHIVDYIRTKGRKDFAEFRNIVKEGIDAVMSLLQTANGYMSIFKSLAEKTPIIGAILGTISAGMSFAQNLHSVIKATRSKKRMRAQKEQAKERIKENQGSANYVEMRHSKADVLKLGKEKLHFNPEAIPQWRWIARKKRLDEMTTEKRTQLQAAGQQSAAPQTATEDPLLDALEDYDIVKELTGANKKRQRQGILDLVFGDAVAFGTSLAALDPTVGALVGNSINLAVGVGTAVKEVVAFLRQIGRNHGWKGCDENKSDANKLKRRHTLAVNLFQRLQGLEKEKITEINPDTTEETEVSKARQGLEKYRLMSDQVNALGVGYGPLMRAQTTREVLDTIRSGFYRDG